MRKLGLGVIILITAAVTALVTSLFWVFAYSVALDGGEDPPKTENIEAAQSGSDPALVVGPSGLAVPVAGVRIETLVDTYSQARAGGERSHDAIDIMAPHGTPVVAAAEGVVEKLFDSRGGGGLTVYVRSPDRRWNYYYAHLQGYAPGLAEGQRVRRGDAIGRVGSTGNANPAGPHLHFAVYRMTQGEDWHEGSPVNPYPLLAGSQSPG